MKKLTKEEFIEKAKQVHGDKYDYSLVKYNGNTKKVQIICPAHGMFWQLPNNHLAGKGCNRCAGHARLTNEEFVERATKVHQGKYTYEHTEYVSGHVPVKITCPIHGVFEQDPFSHLSGHGCGKCADEQNAERIRKPFDWFVENARQLHGDKYAYDKSTYVDTQTKTRIICPEHGEFWQVPYAHLSNQGCPKCGIIKYGSQARIGTEEFIRRSKEVHGSMYDYSNVKYETMRDKVGIICPTHGIFYQEPMHHLEGSGCPVCSFSSLEREMLVFLEEHGIKYVKQAGRNVFEWLGLQRLDFYLPDYNTAIECQGVQHFKSVSCFGGDKGLQVTQERDEMKRRKCQDNGVKLLYFSNEKYTDEMYTNKEQLLEDIRRENEQ